MIRYSPFPNKAHIIPWREWSDDAFSQAFAKDKPVMLFLGAFWCRLCQSMDEQAFSDIEVIALLNAYFIPIRVEYAQRPDVDARYNWNGWPTIAFIAPNGRLLAVVNYLPAAQFKELLIEVCMTYQQSKEELRCMGQNGKGAEAPGQRIDESEFGVCLVKITENMMALADRTHGGYDSGQKFIHPQVNEFLLERYEATHDHRCLDQVCLTLERMRAGEIYDHEGGAYFRTSSGADWSQPHREKLLLEEAGLLINCLTVFRVTQRDHYRRMAQEIIRYLDAKLFEPKTGAFCGCEDFLNDEASEAGDGQFFTIIDRLVYTDANAVVGAAYLDAALLLDEPQYRERALATLEFLWQNCWGDGVGMFHYFDDAPHAPGLLQDQAQMGEALLRAYEMTGGVEYMDRARRLATFMLTELKEPAGGFYDICMRDSVSLMPRLTVIEQNGTAASFLLHLARNTNDDTYRIAARQALTAFPRELERFGVHAAPFGRALAQIAGSRDRSPRF
jgi:uncharacterized protein YyaL (SSP411 family)